MSSSAHAALVVSIIASALGALIMCLLVARYGLSPAPREDAGAAARRLLVTRFGHAFAGVCFVATGMLSLVAVVAETRQAPPLQSQTAVVEPDREAEERLQALVGEVKAIAEQVDQVMTRVGAMDSTARRGGDEVASVNQRAQQMERARAAPPRRAVVAEPPAKHARPSAPRKDVVREAARASQPSTPPASVPAPSAPPPATRAPEPTPAPRVIPAERVSEPAAVPREALPLPARAADPPPVAPAEPPGPTPAAATVEATPRVAGGGAVAARPPGLGDKIREEWKIFREGLATAGDDVKAGLRALGRALGR